MRIPKGYRQREAAALLRRRQRIVSEEIRAQRAEFLARSAGILPEAEEVVAPVPVPAPTPVESEPEVKQPEADSPEVDAPDGEADGEKADGEGGPDDAPEQELAPAAEPVKNKGGRPKKV